MLIAWWCLLCPAYVCATTKEYTCEVGVQVGCGYYVGDASKTIFSNSREVLGAQFRYKFDSRWAMQVKLQRQTLAFSYRPPVTHEQPFPQSVKFHNPAWHVDVVAEYNFFRFGWHPYDMRVKPITPYICLGVGISARNKIATLVTSTSGQFPAFEFLNMSGGLYIPVGVGVKWKFAERWQLQACWQHQIYFTDAIEGYMRGYDKEDAIKENAPSILNDANSLNGSNMLNNDLVSTLTVSVVFEFGKREKKCYFCEE